MIHLRSALHAKLSGYAPLTALVGTRIYHQSAPQSATYPLVVFHRQSGRAHQFFGGDPVQNDLWTVKAIDGPSGSKTSGSAATTEPIADAIDDCLDGASITASLSILRESDVDYAEVDDGSIYRHLGAMYRIFAE